MSIAKTFLSLYASLVILACLMIAGAQFEFVSDKIAALLDRVVEQRYGWELSRFGSLLFDWAYIQERPLTGWGLALKTRYMLNPELVEFRMGNGFSDFIAKFGLIGFGTYACYVLKSFSSYEVNRIKNFYLLSIVFLILNGEIFLAHPLFWCLMFLV